MTIKLAPNQKFTEMCSHCDAPNYLGHLCYCPEEYPTAPKSILGQSKWASLIEAKVNTIIGFILSTLAWHYLVPVIWPELAPHAGWDTAIGITVFFTVISVVRNYFIRRWFNYRSSK